MLVKSIISLAFILIAIPSFYGIPVEEDLALSNEEKIALDQFKKIMEGSFTQSYMNNEIYLIKWLRRAKLNLKTAERLLRAHLQWRKDNQMDTILEEDFSYLDNELPIDLKGTDYHGRPVIAADVSQWDVRRIIIAGKRDETIRVVMRSIEKTCKKIRDKQAKGQNVTQMVVIFDLKGYNLVQHGCLNCVPIYISFIRNFITQYPLMADHLIFVNTPAVFETVVNALDFRRYEQVKIFSQNKKEWQKYLFSIISPDELPDFLGGNRKTGAS